MKKIEKDSKDGKEVEENHNPEEFRMILYKERIHTKVWRFIKKIFGRNKIYTKM